VERVPSAGRTGSTRFDRGRLTFIYQERRSGGQRSNFFQREHPGE